jgi:hypothetical protein
VVVVAWMRVLHHQPQRQQRRGRGVRCCLWRQHPQQEQRAWLGMQQQLQRLLLLLTASAVPPPPRMWVTAAVWWLSAVSAACSNKLLSARGAGCHEQQQLQTLRCGAMGTKAESCVVCGVDTLPCEVPSLLPTLLCRQNRTVLVRGVQLG